MMKKNKRGFTAILLILVMFVAFFNTGNIRRVNADEVSVSIAISSSSVSKGDAVTATVSVSGSSLVAYTLYVTYDSGILQFDSGSGYVGGGSGTLVISGEGSGSTSLNFTAIANGSTGISTSGSEFYDMNMNELSVSHAGAYVTVETVEAESTTKDDKKTTTDKNGASTTEAPTQSNQNTEKEDTSKSKNADLASLEVSPGTLVPSFSADTIYYTVDLEEDVTKLVVSAVTADAKASTSITGTDSLSKGVNSARVTVTAENGAVKIYYITVNCGTVESTKTVMLDGKLYTIVEDDFPDAPTGFTAGGAKYNDIDIPAYVNEAGNAKIVALVDSDENKSWFIFDEEAQSFSKYCEYSPFARYILLSVPKSVELPEGYVETQADLGNGKVTVYENPKNPGFYLVYAVNIDGGAGLYYYDQVERSFIRYQLKDGILAEQEEKEEEIKIEVVSTETRPADILAEEPVKDEGIFTRKNLITMLIGTVALFLVMAIVAIVFILKNVNLMHQLDEAAEENDRNKVASSKSAKQKKEAKAAVTDDTIGIQLEDVIDNNSAVQVEVDEASTISRAMETRPYGIDSAFEVKTEEESAENNAAEPDSGIEDGTAEEAAEDSDEEIEDGTVEEIIEETIEEATEEAETAEEITSESDDMTDTAKLIGEVESVEAELIETEQVETESIETELVEAETVEAETVEAEPVETETSEAEPVISEGAVSTTHIPAKVEKLVVKKPALPEREPEKVALPKQFLDDEDE